MTIHLISEKELLNYVDDLRQAYGWLMYHQVDTGPCPKCHAPNWSKRIGPGFPDLVLAHPNGRMILAELKSQKGALSLAQVAWLLAIREGRGREVYLWRPSDMDDIAKILEPGWTWTAGETLVLPAKYGGTK